MSLVNLWTYSYEVLFVHMRQESFLLMIMDLSGTETVGFQKYIQCSEIGNMATSPFFRTSSRFLSSSGYKGSHSLLGTKGT